MSNPVINSRNFINLRLGINKMYRVYFIPLSLLRYSHLAYARVTEFVSAKTMVL
jgi:hypothetical protein